MIDKQQYIQKFREIYKSKNGMDISNELALQYFEGLIVLVEEIYKPILIKNNE